METDGKSKVKKSFKSSVVLIPPETSWEQINDIRRIHDKSFKRWMAHINLVYPFIEDVNDGEDFVAAADMIREGLRHIEPFEVAFTKDSFGYFRHNKSCTLWLKPVIKVPKEEGETEPAVVSVPTTDELEEIRQKQEKRQQKSAFLDKQEDIPVEQLFSEDLPDGATASNSISVADDVTGSGSTEGHQPKKKKKHQMKKPAPVTKQNFHPSIIDLQKCLEEIYPDFKDLSNIGDLGFQPHLSLGQFTHRSIDQMMKEFQENWKDEVFLVNEIYLISRADFDDPFHVRQTVKLGGK